MTNRPLKATLCRLLVGIALVSSPSSLVRAQSAAGVSDRMASIPLPEHPRPDFQRPEWINLNGAWTFKFDRANAGEGEHWYGGPLSTQNSIRVPFSWGSPLSGVADSADIGWYQRAIQVPAAWRGKRVFLVVGASDWRTSVWLEYVTAILKNLQASGSVVQSFVAKIRIDFLPKRVSKLVRLNQFNPIP